MERDRPGHPSCKVVLGALQQCGDLFRPHPDGAGYRRSTGTGRLLRVMFVDDQDTPVPAAEADIHAPAP